MKRSKSGFHCLECGHGFGTVKAAERASFGESGCPKCGGSDIDMPSDAELDRLADIRRARKEQEQAWRRAS